MGNRTTTLLESPLIPADMKELEAGRIGAQESSGGDSPRGDQPTYGCTAILQEVFLSSLEYCTTHLVFATLTGLLFFAGPIPGTGSRKEQKIKE